MMCQVYRAKGLEASNAILYNHESPVRPERFVTRKITKAVAAIAAGRQDRLALGDVTIRRDWGWAPDYVDAMFRMALHGKGDDFVVATGVTHSIADFAAAAFAVAGIADWQDRIDSDSALLRPADRAAMVGDAGKAAAILDWRPTKSFADIVEAMVVSDLGQEQSR
jgi:GDPmannose 4,6-dehydratase